ncbi:MAG TPA: phenylalanine--tRNA ligase beta subunit-related protein [Ktedonobacterales bacterium]|nr:phenylalanine--tRNA ligase beta subunit-related protein [Ktedonobacterales bacterium]
MTTFRYGAAILERFPAITGGVILATGVRNGPGPESLRAAYLAEQRATLARIGETPLSQLPTLAAWRSAFRRFGVDPTQCRSAAEALLRRLTKKGDIPSINALVDLGNLVSIRYALPVAIFDTRALTGPLTVRFATGEERYTPLGQPDVTEHPTAGEVVFSDDTGLVFAERWCWRQSDQSAARDDTMTAVVTVEAQHDGGGAEIEAALADLLALLERYAGGRVTSAMLDAQHPALTDDSV